MLAAMLALSRPHEAKLREERSPPLPEAEIVTAVAEMALKEQQQQEPQPGGTPPPDAAAVPGILRRLAADTSEARGCPLAWHSLSDGGPCVRPCSLPGRPLSQPSLFELTGPLLLRLPHPHLVVQLITCVGEGHGGPAYCVNTKRIIDLIRMKEARARCAPALSSQCGRPGCPLDLSLCFRSYSFRVVAASRSPFSTRCAG